ncbi:glycoside hydrolase family 3 C-terminal domain-containing protein (plasmid) [Novosphingobium resinovorum]|uniref:glycoside hydrolase family 3 protein n=1 Tax=Novosphingobium TaxID=165696 RepID=UPI002002E63E|nr:MULTISPECIES: glycoside hydrolase family 3 C-terminal domain-containing protein [Novosphingobium]WJM29681.1 glycoside hydrolase family 3 C-terminal domain-containing protein [Novosphingobium resinovorum]
MIEQLSPEQRLAMTSGAAMWSTVGYPDLGIPSLSMGDGPMGIASGRVDERDVALLTPCATALGASWDVDLCARVGALVGGEAVRCGIDMVLAPNVNLARSPLSGRAFEYFSEDPLLAGVLGAAWAGGLQSTGTAAVAKHIVCNDSETDRDSMNAVVDERTLREVYLLPFELCAQAGVGGMLAAYNKLNGDWCSEQHHVLTRIVKQEWGFDGIVMSDWFGTHSAAGSLNGGLDLEMPGPARFMGAKAADVVAQGLVEPARVDDAARRLAHAAQRFAGGKTRPIVDADAKDLLVEAAAAGFVLLKNEGGLLPLQSDALRTLAVIGPNATAPCYQGGTFAKIAVAPDALRPLEAIETQFGTSLAIEYEAGVDPQPRLPTMPVRPARDLGDGCVTGMTIDYFNGQAELHASETRDTNSLVWFSGVHDDVVTLSAPGRILARGVFEAQDDGEHAFYLGATGPVRLRVDGREIIVSDRAVAPSDVMGTLKGGDAQSAVLTLRAGQRADVEVEFLFAPARVHGLWYGIRRPDTPEAMLARAVALAERADAVVLVVGETSDASVESKDRADTRLPEAQVALIEAVTAVNSRTVVVANVGHAFDSSWDDRAAALVVTWYPGEGFGEALAQVLAGEREPGGRMPVSIAHNEADYPAFSLQPEANGDLVYTEGTRIGYRGIAAPRHAFGAGLGYADIVIVSATLAGKGDAKQVDVVVENRSARAGCDVVQVYRRQPELALAGFAKVSLAPGERRTVTVAIPARRLQIWQDGWVDIAEPDLFVGRNAGDVAISL